MSTLAKVPRRKTILIILDGFGVNPSKKNNAVYEANTPRLDEYFSKHIHTTLNASGEAVGLPDGQMGNSEVGHLTIGCGSIIRQDLVRIDKAIKTGSCINNYALLQTLDSAKRRNRPLHLIGLVSDGGVHSHTSHLFALMRACASNGVKAVVHVITDGRDTPPRSAKGYMEALVKVAKETNAEVATICGRYYALDRDRRWDRTQLAWEGCVYGKGTPSSDPLQAIDDAYAEGQSDEFITPRIMPNATLMEKDDDVLFFNFRNDRPRQLSEALAVDDFDGFDRGDFVTISLTTMTEYDKDLLVRVMFSPERPKINLAHTISMAGYKQLHCAETEKYAHVTFFFNSGRERSYAGEDRIVIDSPRVDTYDQKPEMSATAVADTVIDALESQTYGFIVVNFANGDMVGHSAVKNAIVEAVEALDSEVGRVLDAAVEQDYSVLLTSDHGNCEEYIDPITGEPHTQHTVYPVPLLLIDSSLWRLSSSGGLSNLAPTILQLMGLPKPKGMKSDSLLLEEVATTY